jgi:hypothetical protein
MRQLFQHVRRYRIFIECTSDIPKSIHWPRRRRDHPDKPVGASGYWESNVDCILTLHSEMFHSYAKMETGIACPE